jgi:tRNA threonylcarbamoyladenosine biosynthesis protein TsaB
MKILALDSSATVATVALCENDRLLAEYTVNNGNTHSETLLPMIESLLGHFRISARDIDVFAASTGPGSFTGVRIGAATIKGLAFGMNKPCVGVSTLEALAHNLIGFEGLICPVMNARRSQVYTALFRSDGKSLTRLMPDSAIAISELDDILCGYEGESAMLCGDGYEITKKGLEKAQTKNTPERMIHQSAYSVAAVAYSELSRGNTTSDTELKVNYLRPSQAERELMNKNKN